MSTLLSCLNRSSIDIGPRLRAKIETNPGFLSSYRLSSIVIKGTINFTAKAFHFRLFLVSGSNSTATSIRLDMNPQWGGYEPGKPCQGKLELEFCQYEFSVDHEQPGPMFRESVISSVQTTAEALLHRLIVDLQMDRYIFTHEVQGCRHWCATALEKLAVGGFVDATAGRKYEQHELECANTYGNKFPMPRIKGTFLPPKTISKFFTGA